MCRADAACRRPCRDLAERRAHILSRKNPNKYSHPRADGGGAHRLIKLPNLQTSTHQ